MTARMLLSGTTAPALSAPPVESLSKRKRSRFLGVLTGPHTCELLACSLSPQVADPTFLLPALAGLSFLATVELGAADGMEGQVRPAAGLVKNRRVGMVNTRCFRLLTQPRPGALVCLQSPAQALAHAPVSRPRPCPPLRPATAPPLSIHCVCSPRAPRRR